MASSPSYLWLPNWALEILLTLQGEGSIWLVGGAVRDRFINRSTLDYDLVVDGEARKTARLFANSIGGYYFDLDSKRDTGRAIYIDPHRERFVFDFARLHGEAIEADLGQRDFTINAMAVGLNSLEEIIDPTQGLQDIKDGTVRATSSRSFADDPIRVLRAVRFALLLEGRIVPETLHLLRDSIHGLARVSAERVRDELFNILSLPRPIRALRLMDHLDLIAPIFPELISLKEIPLPPNYEVDVWQHTLTVIDHLGHLLAVASPDVDREKVMQLELGEYYFQLGKYRSNLFDSLNAELSQGRSVQQLLYMAALYHDVGKKIALTSEGGRVTFPGHAQEGSRIVQNRAKLLRLSKSEANWLGQVVHQHSRPLGLTKTGGPTKREMYRFLIESQNTTPGTLLLSLADLIAKRDLPVDQDMWGDHIKTVGSLLEAYYFQGGISIQMDPLLRGDEISEELGIATGPQIGRILELVNEAQAVGEINTRNEALILARKIVDSDGDR